MRILHISDFHYQKSERINQQQIEMLEKISQQITDVDIVLFTGDLLEKYKTNILNAYTFFDENFLKKIKYKEILFSCGNHDIDRSRLSNMFKTYINTIEDNEALNNFVLKNQADEFLINTKHIEDYNLFVESQCVYDHKDELYYIKTIKLNSIKYSFVSINLSWTAFDSKKDYGNLLFPTFKIDDIKRITKNSDYKILLSHQPMSYLKEFNRNEMENAVYEHFDAVFYGHTHRANNNICFSSSKGIFACTAPFTFGPEYGFVIIDANFPLCELSIDNYGYNQKTSKFDRECIPNINLPVSQSKREIIAINKAMEIKYENELDIAKNYVVQNNELEFNKIFTPPVLSVMGRVKTGHLGAGSTGPLY